MKFIAAIIAVIFFMPLAQAQLKAGPVCPTFVVDVLEGNVNHKLDCSSTSGEVQKVFPCFSEVIEPANGKCGAVMYKDKGIFFYPDRNYIEISQSFKGTLEPALMGVNRTLLFKLLGNPKIKDASWEAYQVKFGTLILYFDDKGKINKIQISNLSTDVIKLCE
jgi:hypothetical protein